LNARKSEEVKGWEFFFGKSGFSQGLNKNVADEGKYRPGNAALLHFSRSQFLYFLLKRKYFLFINKFYLQNRKQGFTFAPSFINIKVKL
jgi:hypothetical protein